MKTTATTRTIIITRTTATIKSAATTISITSATTKTPGTTTTSATTASTGLNTKNISNAATISTLTSLPTLQDKVRNVVFYLAVKRVRIRGGTFVLFSSLKSCKEAIMSTVKNNNQCNSSLLILTVGVGLLVAN